MTTATAHRTAFEATRSSMKDALLERDSVVDSMLTALLAKQHVLLLGPPGTAKSLAARKLSEAIDGNFFEWLLGKFSTPEEIFGPVSVQGLQQDRFERVGAGKLQQADVGFLDEVWKANSAVLNQLLSIVNERIYHDGTKGAVQCPLEMLVGASNELPQDESLEALYDRFLVRLYIAPIKDEINFLKLIRGKFNGTPISRLDRKHLDQIRTEVSQVKVSLAVAETIGKLRRKVAENGIYVSDRRWLAAVGYLQAAAWVAGAKDVSDDELGTLVDVLWTEPSQRPTIQALIEKVANPVRVKVLRLLDDARERFNGRPKDGELSARQSSLMAIGSRVKQVSGEIRAISPNHQAVKDALAEIGGIQKQLLVEMTNLNQQAIGG
uniref:Putative ATPase domain containing protein n=1 Tax=viral metagenome TaxID=1070528 RepID=A0A6M3M0S4_9ZZZZ